MLTVRHCPRGHILKSLALASRPQVLENWPVLGSRTALFFELLKFCGALEKVFGKRFSVEIAWKIFVKTFFFFWRSPETFLWRRFFFFGEHLRLCPWSLALASSIPVLGLESVCPRKGCPWPWPRIFFVSLALASSHVSSTPPLSVRCLQQLVAINFAKNRENVKRELCLNVLNVIIPFSIIVCCLAVTWCFNNSILSKPKWEGASSG